MKESLKKYYLQIMRNRQTVGKWAKRAMLAACMGIIVGMSAGVAEAVDGNAKDNQYAFVYVNYADRNKDYYEKYDNDSRNWTALGLNSDYELKTYTYNGTKYQYYVHTGFDGEIIGMSAGDGNTQHPIIGNIRVTDQEAAAGVLSSAYIAFDDTGKDTVLSESLNTSSISSYIATTNSGGVLVYKDSQYGVSDEDAKNHGLKSVEVTYANGVYSGTGSDGTTYSTTNPYAVYYMKDGNSVKTFVLTNADGLYEGTVYGANGEVLLTNVSQDENGNTVLTSYWAGEKDASQVALKDSDITVEQYNQALDTLKENDLALACADIKEVKQLTTEQSKAITGAPANVKNAYALVYNDATGSYVNGYIYDTDTNTTYTNADASVTVEQPQKNADGTDNPNGVGTIKVNVDGKTVNVGNNGLYVNVDNSTIKYDETTNSLVAKVNITKEGKKDGDAGNVINNYTIQNQNGEQPVVIQDTDTQYKVTGEAGSGNVVNTYTVTSNVKNAEGEETVVGTIVDTDTTYTVESKDGSVTINSTTVNEAGKTVVNSQTVVTSGEGTTINSDNSIDVNVDTTNNTTYINDNNEVAANTVKEVTVEGKKEGDAANVTNTYTIKNQTGNTVGTIVDTDTTYTVSHQYAEDDNGGIADTGAEATLTLTDSNGKVVSTLTAGSGVYITTDGEGHNYISVDGISEDDAKDIVAESNTHYSGDVSYKEDGKAVQLTTYSGDTLKITGGGDENTKYASEANIVVVENAVDKEVDGKTIKVPTLELKLAQNLTGLESVTATTVNATTVNADTFKAGDTTINTNGMTITGGPTITKTKVDVAGNQIKNVKAGTEDTDAVNVSQLKSAKTEVKAGDNVTVTKTTGENGQDVYTVSASSSADAAAINNKINHVESKLNNRINKVGARAAALAALHPLDFDPDDKLTFAAGYGHYKGENAGAIGAFYRPDEKVMFSVAGTVANGETMINAGISFSLDRTAHQTTSKTAMAREILDLREQVNQLKALVSQLVAPKNVNAQMFPDVPENHWAYEYVAGLQKQGVLDGYPDGNFSGDRTCTRYEFAAMLFRAMKAGQVVPQALVDEFKPELGRIRVDRVSGADSDYHKIERVRVNGDKDFNRDAYGSKQAQAVTSRGPQDVYPNYAEVKASKK